MGPFNKTILNKFSQELRYHFELQQWLTIPLIKVCMNLALKRVCQLDIFYSFAKPIILLLNSLMSQ